MAPEPIAVLRRLGSLPLLAVLVLVLWLALPGRPEEARLAVSNAAWVLAPLWAGLACLRRARRGGAARASWRLLGFGALSWAAGSVAYALQDLTGGAAFPSPADLGFLGLPLLATAALLKTPEIAGTRTSRVRLLTDGVVVAAALLVLALLAGLGAELQNGSDPLAGRVRLAFAACNALAAAVAVQLLVRFPRRPWPGAALAALGVLVVTLADIGYSTLASRGGWSAGGLADASWVVGFLLVAAAAGRPALAPASRPAGSSHRALPLVPAATAGVALLLSGRLLTGMDAVLAGTVMTLGAALAMRQLLLASENAALHRSLERRVAERTAALHRTERLYRHRAYTDPLTGLANRDAFAEALSCAASGSTGSLAVVMLDLDGFKQVNDGYGHKRGDEVLIAVAERLRVRLAVEPSGAAVLARLGGDEFAVLLPDVATADDAGGLAADLVRLLRENYPFPDRQVFLGASAGVSVAERPLRRPPMELLREADTAMYGAKQAGGGGVRRFDADMRSAARLRVALESDLHRAVRDGELEVHFQPIMAVASGEVVGVEALSRWRHADRGPISPLEFIAAAERSGLIVDLDRQAMETTCRQLAAWRRHAPELKCGINVSPRSLREPDAVESITAAIARHGLPPSAIVLEVTESLFFGDEAHVAAVLGGLHEAGVTLALDDFGTGFSSLSRLSQHPFSVLKIDRSFLAELDDADRPPPILLATLAMARGLGLDTVAEGVETPEQLAFLRRHGCAFAQGYLLGRPGAPGLLPPTVAPISPPVVPQPRRIPAAICAAALAGSSAPVIGRPMTSTSAPSASA